MHPMVLVTWRDAHFEFESADAAPPIDWLVQTVGFLIGRGPVFCSVASERLPAGDWRAVTHIPADAVVEIRTLEVSPSP